MGIFTALDLFLKPLHKFVKLNYLLLLIRNIFFVFLIVFPWSAQNCEYEWEYTRDILRIRISRGANNCVQSVFEKKHLIMIFPPTLNLYYPVKG